MQNYKVHAYVISMEFSAVNRRNATRAGSEEGRLFSQAITDVARAMNNVIFRSCFI